LGHGVEASARPIGFDPGGDKMKNTDADQEAYRQRILAALHQSLRPELLNRIQHIVFFNPLTEESIRRIIDKIVNSLGTRLQERKIKLELTEATYELLMREGFKPRFGAREMERTIDRLLIQPLGKALLEGGFAEGTTVRVDVSDSKLILEDAQLTRAVDLSDSNLRKTIMPIEKPIDAADLMRRVEHVLDEIYHDCVVYLVRVAVDNTFVLGPEKICGRVLGLVDPEYGWPECVEVKDIKNVRDIAPGPRRHPFICRSGVCLAVGIRIDEYESIKSKA
jgi:hypothetical protein